MSTGIQHNIEPEVLSTYKLTGEVQISYTCELTCECGKGGCGTLFRAESNAGHDDLWLGSKCITKLGVEPCAGLLSDKERALRPTTQLQHIRGRALDILWRNSIAAPGWHPAPARVVPAGSPAPR
jgi:hypothetical protein